MSTSDKFNSGGKIIQAELFNPSGTPNGGAIVIAFGTHGMLETWGSEIRAYADALSQKGFVAIIPDYFVSTSSKPGLEALQEISIHRDTWQETIANAVAHVSAFPNIAQPTDIIRCEVWCCTSNIVNSSDNYSFITSFSEDLLFRTKTFITFFCY
jgi:dienelactone hydrolase